MDKITSDTLVSSTELACILGLTGRRIRQLAEDGVLQKNGKGRFVLADAVQRYLLTFSPADEEDVELSRNRLRSEVMLKQSKATIAKLEAAELQSKMHRSEDVAAMTEDLIYTIRGALMSLPGRLAVDAAAAESASEASEIIRREVYEVMRELAKYRYDSQKYEERVRAQMDWNTADGYDGD